jgi:hypothetical protein
MVADFKSEKTAFARETGIDKTKPSGTERHWLMRGLTQSGGKLPLFDEWGQRINERTMRACIDHGWAEPWFANPIKPDWRVCRLTEAGRRALAEKPD